MTASAATACKYCGEALKIGRVGRKRKFCSSRCRSAAHREWLFVSRNAGSIGAAQNDNTSAVPKKRAA
jgi:endogenous inhibitor of DNA gyrase (YacG/DUF329 family)